MCPRQLRSISASFQLHCPRCGSSYRQPINAHLASCNRVQLRAIALATALWLRRCFARSAPKLRLSEIESPRLGGLPVGVNVRSGRANEDLQAFHMRLHGLIPAQNGGAIAGAVERLGRAINTDGQTFVTVLRIETSFSQITSLFPRHINAVTPQGFMLKLICFLLAFSFVI